MQNAYQGTQSRVPGVLGVLGEGKLWHKKCFVNTFAYNAHAKPNKMTWGVGETGGLQAIMTQC